MVKIYLSALALTLAIGAPLCANAAGRVLDAASPYATLARHHASAAAEPAAYAAMLQRSSPRAEALGEMTALLREVGVSGIDLRALAAGARAHGSRYAKYAPSSSGFVDTPVDPGPPPSAPDTSGIDAANATMQMNNDMIAAQAQNDAAQQQFNDGMAAAQQTEINANQ